MIKVIGVGDNVVDHYLHNDMAYPGGNSLNVAVYSRLMGNEAAYMGVFGDDKSAKIVHSAIRELGMDMSHCRFLHGENGRAQVTMKDGDRVFVASNRGGISKFNPLEFSEMDIEYVKSYDLMHTGIYSYVLGSLKMLSERGVRISLDFSEHFDEGALREYCPSLWAAAISSSGRTDEENLALIRKVQDYGVSVVILTRGSRGALVSVDGRLYEQSPCLVKPVDTLGAGDSFIASFLSNYLSGIKDARDFDVSSPRGIVTAEEYKDALIKVCLYRAAVFSAETCLKEGSFGFGQKWEDGK